MTPKTSWTCFQVSPSLTWPLGKGARSCRAGVDRELVVVRFDNSKLEALFDFDFVVKALRTTRVTTIAAILGIIMYISIEAKSSVVSGRGRGCVCVAGGVAVCEWPGAWLCVSGWGRGCVERAASDGRCRHTSWEYGL